MMSLGVRAIKELQDLKGKTLAEIVEFCEGNPKIQQVCFSSRDALFALFEHLCKEQKLKMNDLLKSREDIARPEDCERFIKNLVQGISWNYAVMAPYDPTHQQDVPYLILPEANDNSDLPVHLNIKGLLPASGVLGVSFDCKIDISYRVDYSRSETETCRFTKCAFLHPEKREDGVSYFNFRFNAISMIFHEVLDELEGLVIKKSPVEKMLVVYFNVPWANQASVDFTEVDYVSEVDEIALILARLETFSFTKTGRDGDPPEFAIEFTFVNKDVTNTYVNVLIAPKPILMN